MTTFPSLRYTTSHCDARPRCGLRVGQYFYGGDSIDLTAPSRITFAPWQADQGGELKAHDELTEKWQVEWRKLHDSCWEVVRVGGLKA